MPQTRNAEAFCVVRAKYDFGQAGFCIFGRRGPSPGTHPPMISWIAQRAAAYLRRNPIWRFIGRKSAIIANQKRQSDRMTAFPLHKRQISESLAAALMALALLANWTSRAFIASHAADLP